MNKGEEMKLIDILINSCALLGLKNEQAVLENLTYENLSNIEGNKNIEELIYLSQYSIRELCSNYIPVSDVKEIDTTDKKYPLNNLTNFIRVQNVFKDDVTVNFKIIGRNIIFNEDGKYLIKYLTFPTFDNVFDEIDFLSNFSPDAIVLGLCSYYSLSKGMFEEFNVYHDKYIERAESLKSLRVFDLPRRRWV